MPAPTFILKLLISTSYLAGLFDIFNNYYSFFYENVVFPALAEYSYFSADFRLKIFLYYS